MPRKTLIPFSTLPLILPAVVVATGAPCPRANRSPRNINPAAAIPEYRSKIRRSNSLILHPPASCQTTPSASDHTATSPAILPPSHEHHSTPRSHRLLHHPRRSSRRRPRHPQHRLDHPQ